MSNLTKSSRKARADRAGSLQESDFLDSEEANVLETLNVINMVTNNTPWETGGLVAFLAPYLVRLPFTEIVIETHRPMPGVKREAQRFASAKTTLRDETKLTIGILSPKRAASRTDLLDRLSMADDLKPNEALIPALALGHLAHILNTRISVQGNSKWTCKRGSCECKVKLNAYLRPIKGDTKARTTKEKPLATLKRSLRSAEQSVDYCQTRLNKATKRRDLLLRRINKAEAKIVDEMGPSA
jgi:hypothetical protein